MAANRFRECANAIAKSSAIFTATPSLRSDVPKRRGTAAVDNFVAVSAEALRLEMVAACWKGAVILLVNSYINISFSLHQHTSRPFDEIAMLHLDVIANNACNAHKTSP